MEVDCPWNFGERCRSNFNTEEIGALFPIKDDSIHIFGKLFNTKIPGTNANLRMMKERDDQWCGRYFGAKYHMLASTFPGKDKGGPDCGTDDLMHNIYNKCIDGFNLKCKKKIFGG